MDFSHLGLVVVDQPHTVLRPTAFDIHFFFQFPAHALEIWRKVSLEVEGRDMAADSNRTFGMQSGLSLSGTSLVMKKFIPALKNAVGNQLLEGRILFHLRTWPIAGMLRVKKHAEITIDVVAETLKVADLVKDRRGDDKHMFNAHRFFAL
jgi:hypothetical protein